MSWLHKALSFVVIAALSVVGSPTAQAEEVAPPRGPNFVIIMADDLGYGDLGCYGAKHVETPRIDRMAAEGLRLTDFHANGAVCSPTRAALLTGRYQQRAGISGVITAKNHRDEGLAPDEITFAELLSDAGYATALFGKWHLGYQPEFNPVRQGFDQFRGFVSGNVDYFSHVDQTGVYDWWGGEKQIKEEGYTTELITEHAVRFIRQHRGQPFCVYLAHEAPHYPYQGPGDEAERQIGKKFSVLGSRRDRSAAYAEMIAALDEGVGAVLDALVEHDLDRNTLVVFCSDNGASKVGSTGPLRGKKGTLWEGGHRVPCLLWWPETIPTGTRGDLTMTFDLMPTMLDLAAVAVPEGHQLDGRSLHGLWSGKGSPFPPRKLFWGHQRSARPGGALAMRDGPWKLLIDGKQTSLFNLETDLAEQHDLAKKQPQRVKQMRAALSAWQQDVQKSQKPAR